MDTTREADRRVEEARQSLLAHFEELGRRIQQAKDKLDIKAKIAAHPRAAVGIAFGIGALAGLLGTRSRPSEAKAEAKGGIIGALVATAGSLAFTLAKNIAMNQLSTNARDWWDRRNMEAEASTTRDVESFLEH